MSVHGDVKHLDSNENQTYLNHHEIKNGSQNYLLDIKPTKFTNVDKLLTQHQFNSEFSILIKHLLDEPTETQVEIVNSLRRLLKYHAFPSNLVLPELNKQIIFQMFHQFLTQEQIGSKNKLNRIITEYTMLIVDLIPNVPIESLEQKNCLSLILPYLIPNLGHEAIEIRRVTLRLLHVYMRYTRKLNEMIDFYIEFGLKSKNKNAQKGCILSLPLLFTQEFFNLHENMANNSKEVITNLNLFPLLQCLSDLLVHADTRLFYAIYLAIQRLHTLLGNRVFKLYLQRVDQEAVFLYQKILSRNSSTASSNNFDNDQLNTDENQNQAFLRRNENVNRLVLKENLLNKVESKNVDKNSLNQKNIDYNDLPQFDKYDKLMLDQLISNEEEIRKQSFEILSSPTSLIQDDVIEEDLDLHEPIAYEPPSFNDFNVSYFKNKQIQFAEQETKNAINEFRGKEQDNLMNLNKTFIEVNKRNKSTKNKFNSKEANNSNKMEIVFNENETIYGLFPTYIIQKALSTKLALKNEAINQILTILKQCTCTHLTLVTLNNNLNHFFNHFLVKLIEHPNFKITLQALEVIEVLVNRLKNQIIAYLPDLINVIVKRLGDTRIVVRQQTIQITHLIILKFPTQSVIDALIPHLANRNPRVRTEVVNRITVILILIPRDQFNLCALCYELSSLLVDKKRIVRQAVLECIAVLGQCLGPERSRKLIRCAEAIERVQDTPGLVAAVRARLARRDLPRVLPDATIKYVLNPAGFAGWYPSLADADIDWILQGSTSATSTPPYFKIKTPFNYCASYQDLTNTKNLCELKRGSCILATHKPNQLVDQPQHNLDNLINFDKNLYSQINPPNTEAKQSESTVEIERLIEKNTTDQLKSRELSTGESNFSFQSEQSLDQSDNSKELWHYYHQKFKQNFDNEFVNDSQVYDKFDLEADFDTINFEKKNNEKEIIHYLQSSKAISMPAINSAHLSDISERSEFTHHSKNLGDFENENYYNKNSSSAQCDSDHKLNISDFDKEKKNNENNCKNEYKKNVLKDCEKTHQKQNKDYNKEFIKSQAKDEGKTIDKDYENNDNSKNYDEDHEKNCDKDLDKENLNVEKDVNQIKVYKNKIEINIQNENPENENLTRNSELDTGELSKESKLRKRSSISVKLKNNLEFNNESEKEKTNENQEIIENTKVIKRKLSEQKNVENTSFETEQNQNKQENATVKNSIHEKIYSKQEQIIDEQFNLDSEYIKQYKSNVNRRRESHSTSPQKRRSQKALVYLETNQPSNHTAYQQLLRIQPAIPSNANIRNILENVTKTEGPFKEPEEALKAAIAAFTQDAWTTKIEGMLAITRLATFHPNILKKELHTVVLALAYEIKNLRSTVSRSAIYTLGDLLFKMRGFIDVEMDIVAQALLQKCGENIQFMREDIEKSLLNFVKYMPPIRASLAIINHGANHRNILVRRISAYYLAILIENMGATKSLLGPRDLAESLLPTAASLLLDRDAHTRYSARKIFNVLINHNQLNILLSKHVQPAIYRAIIGSLQSIKRRGIGEKPVESIAK